MQNGKLLRRHLRREMISAEELMGVLRQHGIEKLEQVKSAIMEGDGEISVIKYEGEAQAPQPTGKDKAFG